MKAFAGMLRTGLKGSLLCVGSTSLFASDINLRAGVTDLSRHIQDLHHLSLTICVVVGIIVFGAMFYAMFAFRRDRHPEPAKFHHSLLVEVIWTVIPVLILVAIAVPATYALIEIEDNSNSDLTVLITAQQWKWHYQYVEADIGYFSNLATPQEQIDNLEPKGEHRVDSRWRVRTNSAE